MSFYQSHMDSVDTTLTSVVVAIFLILLTVLYYWIKNRGVLPGPKGLPYLGIYPVLTNDNTVSKFEEYKEKYGDMFSFTFMGSLYIHLGSIKAMREIQSQKSDCFTDRPKNFSIANIMIQNGLFGVNGEPWKILRKFFIQKFKEYGLNAVRGDLAGPLYDSLNAAINHLKTAHKKPVNIMDFLSKHCAISMRKVLFGEDGVTDEELSKMIIGFTESVAGSFGIGSLLIGPLFKILLHTQPSLRKVSKDIQTMKKVTLKCIKRIESSMSKDQATCIVEEFYKEKNERRKKNDPTWKYFTDEALVDTLFQLVGDGIASVAAFIAGILNDLLQHTEEQEKLYSEIMEVIGPNRQPSTEDRPNLPYTNAFLNEYTRTTKFLDYLPSLECTRETVVRGYKIPKGSITLLNFWAAHHDEETFDDPYTFNPNRYLSSSGEPKAESPVSFGMGRRMCTGEPFVMLQTFLFLTTIVQNFKVVSSNATPEKSLDFLISGKLELTFKPRKEM